ncbi:MBL fold metallo-hydrolase [Desulfovibrio sp. OttesenSCG-928-C14]|nr:MBL fold metallo-hydrolase [Desulfovibrio sp. OttesenSCG-928-C14]
MKMTFLGAAQTVTGSCYMIEAAGARFAVDCGMHQGNKEIEKRNRALDPYEPECIDFFLMTHAHIDHSGLLPRMVRDGYSGPIYCTEPTRDLLDIMLQDSAHIQEMEAEWENRKLSRKGAKTLVEPLYTEEDAKAATKLLSSVRYGEAFEPAPGVKVAYRDAGHILGSSFLELEITEEGKVTRLVFSGDLGRADSLILNDPESPALPNVDYLIMESTYGDRDHKNAGRSRDELAEAIAYCYKQNGKVVIPAFAVERTQEIIYTLFLLLKDGRLPKDMPVFLDSPLAIRATEVFRKYPGYADEETRAYLDRGEDPLNLPNLRYTLTTDESRAINDYKGPAVIISASGMCNAGRIKHHLRHNIWDGKNAVVFVGYQGVGTPGRKIVDGAKQITLLGDEVAIKARIFTIGGFSAHAGQSQLMDWVRSFPREGLNIILTHGETRAQKTLAELLRREFGLTAKIPQYLEEVTLEPGKALVARLDRKRSMPAVDWHLLLGHGQNILDSIRGQAALLEGLPWEEQVELRDQLLLLTARLDDFRQMAALAGGADSSNPQ